MLLVREFDAVTGSRAGGSKNEDAHWDRTSADWFMNVVKEDISEKDAEERVTMRRVILSGEP